MDKRSLAVLVSLCLSCGALGCKQDSKESAPTSPSDDVAGQSQAPSADAAGQSETPGAEASPDAEAVAGSVNGDASDAAPETIDLAVVQDPAAPLPDAVRSAFAALASDPDPAALVRNNHYWISNEHAQWVYRPEVENLGGVLSGVGTDQVYLLAAWARSSIVVPLDFDRAITRLHFAYGVAFERAATPEAFIALWKPKAEAEMVALIGEVFASDPEEAAAIQRSYTRARQQVNRRLRLYGKYPEGEPNFVTDPEQYAFVRSLWLNKRVFPVCGDLTADTAMVDLARVTREIGVDLRILYLSNAEVYFPYGPSFRRNLVVQNYSDKSVILRTRQHKGYGLAVPKDYHYNVQPSANFVDYLTNNVSDDVKKLFKLRRDTDVLGLSINDQPVPHSKSKPEIAPMPPWFESE